MTYNEYLKQYEIIEKSMLELDELKKQIRETKEKLETEKSRLRTLEKERSSLRRGAFSKIDLEQNAIDIRKSLFNIEQYFTFLAQNDGTSYLCKIEEACHAIQMANKETPEFYKQYEQVMIIKGRKAQIKLWQRKIDNVREELKQKDEEDNRKRKEKRELEYARKKREEEDNA
ncbi:MAG: hypothetical protein IJX55_01355, partial [Clostridia bacterium]|nr:hypothetical protein [Clostridia bacterium]